MFITTNSNQEVQELQEIEMQQKQQSAGTIEKPEDL